MFGRQRQPIPQQAVVAPPATAPDLGVVFHVMPSAFLGQDAQPLQPPPAPPVVVSPTLPPAEPAPLPEPADSPTQAPVARGRLWPLILGLLLFFTVSLLVFAYFYSRFTTTSRPTPSVSPTVTPATTSPVLTNTVSVSPSPSPVVPVQGVDTDSDGLTNVEELLYGTNFRNPDSDADTYLDGNEVFHRYDPNGLAPSTLLSTGSVKPFEKVDQSFSVLYPSAWRVDSTTDPVVISFIPGGSLTTTFQIRSTVHDVGQSLLAFLAAQHPEILRGVYQAFTTKEGFEAVALPDGRTVYVNIGDKIIEFFYDIGKDSTIEYLQTFKMMVNSLNILGT